MKENHTDRKNKYSSDVKPADALGTLRERSRGSRFSVVIIAVIGLIVVAFIGGAFFRSITGGVNIPDVPKVNI